MLPVKNGQITIIEFIGRVSHEILIENYSFGLDWMLFFVVIISNKGLAQVKSSQIKLP